MYLSHVELQKIADEIISGCDHDGHPFSTDQIRVCSIDLRVGPVFWKFARRKRAIALNKHSIFEISERRLWRKIVLRPGEYIELKPGEMLLGSTYERIKMPDALVGKINTRSSYARLGLSTACNCDLVNPGYTGNVPLELTNTTRSKFQIYPYLPLCQLFVMRVDGEVEKSYSHVQFGSLYMNDDGGPSRWWRDALAMRISTKALPNQMEDATLTELRRRFEKIDDTGIYRLERLLDKKRFGNSDELMQAFSKSERKKFLIYRAARDFFRWAFPVLFLMILRNLSDGSTESNVLDYIMWGAAVVLFFPFVYFWSKPEQKYYPSI